MKTEHHATATRVASGLFIILTILSALGQNLGRLSIPPWEICWTHSFTMIEQCLSFLDVLFATLTEPYTLVPIFIMTAIGTESYIKRDTIRNHFFSSDED